MSYARYGNLGTDRRSQSATQYGPVYRTSGNIGVNKAENYAPPPHQNQGAQSPAMHGVPEITSKEEKLKFIQGYPVCVIYVYGSFCGPCKAMAPKYAQLAAEMRSRGIMLVKEEVQQGLSPHVTAVPYFEIYVNGQRTGDAINNDFNMLVERLKSFS